PETAQGAAISTESLPPEGREPRDDRCVRFAARRSCSPRKPHHGNRAQPERRARTLSRIGRRKNHGGRVPGLLHVSRYVAANSSASRVAGGQASCAWNGPVLHGFAALFSAAPTLAGKGRSQPQYRVERTM